MFVGDKKTILLRTTDLQQFTLRSLSSGPRTNGGSRVCRTSGTGYRREVGFDGCSLWRRPSIFGVAGRSDELQETVVIPNQPSEYWAEQNSYWLRFYRVLCGWPTWETSVSPQGVDRRLQVTIQVTLLNGV